MMRRSALAFAAAFLAALFGLCAPAAAAEYRAGALTVSNPYGPDTPPNARTAAAYLQIRNDGDAPDRLIGVESARADTVELHATQKDGEVLRMRSIDAVDIPAHGAVTFAPSGLHVMMVGLKAPLKAGETVRLTLVFEKAGRLEIDMDVLRPARAPAQTPHGH